MRFAGLGSEEGGQLAVSVEPFIIHFWNQNVIVFVEEFTESIWKRVNVAEINRAHLVAFGHHAVGGFLDRAVCRSPADEEKRSTGFTVDFRVGKRGGEVDKLVAALGGHLFVIERIAGWVTPFVVLEPGDDRIFLLGGRRAR